jgi:hypothetical protein
MKAGFVINGEKIIVQELQNLQQKGGKAVARVVLKSGLNIIAKQMRRDLDPKVKEAAKAIGTRVTVTRQNVTRAKVGFGVGKNTRRMKFTRKRTGQGGVGIGPNNVHWYIVGTAARWRYGAAGGQTTNRRKRRAASIAAGEQGRRSTGTMPAQQPGLAANAARKSVSEMRAVMSRAGKRYLEAMAARAAKRVAKANQRRAEIRLLQATGKG